MAEVGQGDEKVIRICALMCCAEGGKTLFCSQFSHSYDLKSLCRSFQFFAASVTVKTEKKNITFFPK